MTQEEFNIVFELQMRKCADILAHKKKEYTGDNIDRLSAFKIAAALQNCDPKAPYQWKHMIGQRTCRRNTDETRIVMLYIWQRLYKLSPILFAPDLTGPFCQRGSCMEKQMSCQNPISKLWMPADILKTDYPLLIRKEMSSHKD